MAKEDERLTVRVNNIPKSATAKDLMELFECLIGEGEVYACDIASHHKKWNSRGYGRVQFQTLVAKSKATHLSRDGKLVFFKNGGSSVLSLSPSFDDVVVRPLDPSNRVRGGTLHSGLLLESDDKEEEEEDDDCMFVIESWHDVKAFIMPERNSLLFTLNHNNNNNNNNTNNKNEVNDELIYKFEIPFDYILETSITTLSALLVKLKYAPKIFRKVSGPNVNAKLTENRYFMCKEDFGFVWVRTTDFSLVKSIGQSTCLCFEFKDDQAPAEVFRSLPYFKKEIHNLVLEDGEEFGSTTSDDLVPLVKCPPSYCKLPYEILFQLCSLVHTHKISLASVDDDLIDLLSSLDVDTAMLIIQKLHKRQYTCYNPVQFIKIRQHIFTANNSNKNLPSSSVTSHNTMRCHRVLVTPTKIYCLGPELETSNYVVKNFSEYASDFMRVTFVEEDWSKLPANAVSATIEQGIFGKPYKTDIYHRILSVLRDGIVIGTKRFQFLAFSASQLRSNAVWMFASNKNVKAEDVREWMGCFNKIRSVSKCAARMGQLFSASTQTVEVLPQAVEIIPDIEVTTDGVSYCFSDGIGKISPSFAKQVADKCGLETTPSAFQIRYGGYKGVVAVDRNSYSKLSLRKSMLKFDSKNRMLNITKWSDSMSCYLNREIITLLSTLGVDDSVFLVMQEQHLRLLGKMLSSREAALNVLESFSGNDAKDILGKMLQGGYEPNEEPYLSMMLKAHLDNLLYDLKVRCRIHISKGRILIGCLDETGFLDYGQVYARISLTKSELLQFEGGRQKNFQKVDDSTSVVIGKVVVTKNPCLHPGDVRVLEAVCEVGLVDKGLVDCIVFPQKGKRPHPNECSGGDLDGDLYFISWDANLIPSQTVAPMDYSGRRPRIMDHDVTLEEIHSFFVDYMVNDTLGIISTAHLIHADREPTKALSPVCLQLANLHSMAVDFAKTGAPAEMPNFLKPKEFPDFMERGEKSTYTSNGVLGKLYRTIITSSVLSFQNKSDLASSVAMMEEEGGAARAAYYDVDLVVEGFEEFVGIAKNHREMYSDKMTTLMNFYCAQSEDEILTGNLRTRSNYLQRDNRKYTEMRDRITVSMKSLYKEAKGWFKAASCCRVKEDDEQKKKKLASAWYHVTYHPTYSHESLHCLGFPWIMGHVLLTIKSNKSSSLQSQ